MSEVSAAEERARRREERRRKRQEEREAEEREQMELEAELKRQEELSLEASFNTSMNMNGNGSYSNEEVAEENDVMTTPRFSRPKVPEVTLDSENDFDEKDMKRMVTTNGNGYHGNGYHDDDDDDEISHSEGDYSSEDDEVYTDDEEEHRHGNGTYKNGEDEDDYDESDEELKRPLPIIKEPKSMNGNGNGHPLKATKRSQNGGLKVIGQYDSGSSSNDESMLEGKEKLHKLANGTTTNGTAENNGYHHDLKSPSKINGQKEAIMLRKTPRANSIQDEDDKEIGEAEKKAVELRQKRAQEDEERWREEEEMRKAERDQYARDLEALEEKAERRKRQKEEEERKKQKEEEERKIREAEEAQKRKEEIERRRQEAGERLRNMMNGKSKNPLRANYNITAAIAKAKEEHKQSDEELLKERQRVLDERVPPLNIGSNFTVENLKELAKQLHHKLTQVYAAKFDLEQRKKRQDYDLHELDERIKDLSKTKPAINKTPVKIDSGIVSKIKEQGFLTETKPKKKSFFQERNEGIATSGGVAGRLSLFQNKIDKGENKSEIRKSGSPRSWKSPQADKCFICKKSVYTMEKLEVNKNFYHQSCFKCVYCNKILNLSHYSLYLGEVYCKPHQRKVEWEDLQAGIKKGIDSGLNGANGMEETPMEA